MRCSASTPANGVFMLLYLDLAYGEANKAGRLGTLAGLREAIIHDAVKRIARNS